MKNTILLIGLFFSINLFSKETVIKLTGMRCGSCKNKMKTCFKENKYVKKRADVVVNMENPKSQTITLKNPIKEITTGGIKELIKKQGYTYVSLTEKKSKL